MTPTSNVKLTFFAAGCAVLAAAALAPVAARGLQNPGERTIYVSVMDGTGAAVPDMKATEFVVKEDGTARDVVSATRATEPISYALLIDTTATAIPAVIDIREGVTAFCELLLGVAPKTQISLTEFGGVAMTSRPFTSNLADLKTALTKMVPQKGAAPVMNEALVEVSKQFAKMPEGSRRVIVSVNIEAAKESSTTPPQVVMDEVRKSGATLWAVSVSDAGKRNANREQLLKVLAANSGGRAMVVDNRNLIGEVLRVFAANSFSQYAVTFKAGDKPAKVTDITSTRAGAISLSMKWNSK